MTRIEQRILFIGGGNMAQALMGGIGSSGIIEPEQIAAVDPDPAQRAQFDTAFESAEDGVRWMGENGVVVLAVKPQMLAEAAAPVKAALEGDDLHPLAISILAGTRAQQVHEALAGQARVIRVMPNLGASVSKGMTAIAMGPGASDEDLRLAESLFWAVGRTITIEESMMDAFTGLAGSGPAYVFYLAEGMVRAAIEMGFSETDAQVIVRQTIAGAGMLLARDEGDPAALRAQVTSKNGTTAAGTTALDEASVMEAITRAVIAARDRGAELGQV